MAFIQERLAQAAEQRERARKLVAAVRDPLLSGFKALIAQQRIIDAVHEYQQTNGADLTTAAMVIDILRGKSR